MGTSEKLFETLALAVLAAGLVALLFVPRAGGIGGFGTVGAERGLVVDRGPKGALYVSGQLFVNLDRGASGAAVEAQRRSAGHEASPGSQYCADLLSPATERSG
jgi:hypothetical protein